MSSSGNSSKDGDNNKREEPSPEFKKLVEADKRTILERALRASLEDMARGMDKMNLSEASGSQSDADSGILPDIDDPKQKTFEQIYDWIFNDDSDDEAEIDQAWEKILKDAEEAFERQSKPE